MKLYFFFSLFALIQIAVGYKLQTEYSGDMFFDKFDYYSKPDPTSGFVQYQNAESAQSMDLVYVQDNRVFIKAENSTITPKGRPSVRITSKETYNSGLFVFDLNHIPTGFGTWPAFWLAGQNLAINGEIDIVEGVNNSTVNSFSTYPSSPCKNTTQKRAFIAREKSKRDYKPNSFGPGLNKNGGGVFVMQWQDASGIQSWFFPRSDIPKDIRSGKPAPSTWSKPNAEMLFNTGCSTRYFSDLRIIINLTFCGRWAGSAQSWSRTGIKDTSCASFVQNNPSAFDEAYWDINSIKVYQL